MKKMVEPRDYYEMRRGGMEIYAQGHNLCRRCEEREGTADDRE